jgi:hypothetical protein
MANKHSRGQFRFPACLRNCAAVVKVNKYVYGHPHVCEVCADNPTVEKRRTPMSSG